VAKEVLKRLEGAANYKGTSPYAAELYRAAAREIEGLKLRIQFLEEDKKRKELVCSVSSIARTENMERTR
jgi:hypothetical protein